MPLATTLHSLNQCTHDADKRLQALIVSIASSATTFHTLNQCTHDVRTVYARCASRCWCWRSLEAGRSLASGDRILPLRAGTDYFSARSTNDGSLRPGPPRSEQTIPAMGGVYILCALDRPAPICVICYALTKTCKHNQNRAEFMSASRA